MPPADKHPDARKHAAPHAPIVLFLHVSHHQFAIEDRDHTGQPFTFRNLADGIEAQTHGAVVHLRRAAQTIPIAFELREAAPDDALDAYHLVSEASIESPTGILVVASPEATAKETITVPAGWLRVQVRQAELDTAPYDYGEGADHYRVVFWPAPKAKPRVLHTRIPKGDALFAPRTATVAALESELASPDPTARALAVADALRHVCAGKDTAGGAFALLERASRDSHPLVRAVLVSSLGLAPAPYRAQVFALLEALAEDAAPEVRRRVPEALARLAGSDAAARMVALLGSSHPEVAGSVVQRMWSIAESVETPTMIPMLESANHDTRLAALRALAGVAEARGQSALLPVADAVRALAKDKRRDVKTAATELARKLGPAAKTRAKRR